MRITLLLLAAGLGMAASGVAAAAQPAKGSMIRSGSPHGAWQPGGRWPGFKGVRPFRPHPGRGHGRHRGHHWSGNPEFLHSYGTGGIAGPFEAVDPHGGGFFAGGGGAVRVRGGRPHYDYDRSYPYQWASAAGGTEPGWDEGPNAAERPARCRMENRVRVCRGW